ncbi:SDR family oxidoreductase [Companilactobacillus sp.]|uniref:SDR family oxidoreductase n=1 Tax=Companilactobacillus sp. TaxID=2767905 RepID=UPI0025BE2802|nr:SDR family oxidoreductase [Companilactobacillus sp.]MCH4008978.1 SDR family oxidoreductase [Companilactobacillus sp.]MCH4050843.1 SDR family oxidoreductase [Companilactobacillus sp.]MCH4076921.1 SDR family oxidoreductase [Companilactobacillus sp.]MCH4125496.1 SDR family oxidoreductase [Companilactobacillus sp.]MCI1311205.1 SDR family oxidoreductase [Companilactobacillus sp.]
MKVLIIGAHGKVGHLLIGELQSHNIDFVAGLRSEEQIKAYQANNIPTQYIDLTGSLDDIHDSIIASGADVLVFTAGAGGAGYDLTMEIDLDGAIKTMMVAEAAGIKRYIMVSAMYSEDRSKWEASGIRPYYIAKHYADEHLRGTDLDYTILHPGLLTDEESVGKIKLSKDGGSVPRIDVAKTIVQAIETPSTIKKEYEFASGDEPIANVIK